MDDVVDHMGRLLGDAPDLVTVDQHCRVVYDRGRGWGWLRAVQDERPKENYRCSRSPLVDLQDHGIARLKPLPDRPGRRR